MFILPAECQKPDPVEHREIKRKPVSPDMEDVMD